MAKTKLNMKSILAAARDSGCTDAKTIIKAFDYAAEKGYTQGVISASWMEKIHGWKSFNEKAVLTLMDRSQSYPGDCVTVPKDVLAIFSPTTRKTKTTKTRATKATATTKAPAQPVATTNSSKKMNLRTLLHKCYESSIDDADTIIDILQKMKESGYEVSDKDMDYALGWKDYNKFSFKKMVERTFKGDNGFSKYELLDCVDFNKFVPIQKQKANGQPLNVRTVLNRFYDKNCYDALKIAATLQDLEIAGYTGCELYNVPGLINKTTDEVKALLTEAKNGTGIFEGQDILDCPNF